ncbi:phenylalanine--tRNA ligase subunit beta [Companilactobacillus sp. DQM5]|uniref:phenylalanine--tRNA ligase subunit beta n=1 Tax=Companilactobacillus sp. DQM5 TaxID=3463359 RepID=UPI004059FE78
MKISLNWLKDYLQIDETPQEIANRVSLTGIEVADVIKPAEGLKKIVVGHINKIEPHPDSDHLNICQVDVGESEDYQIVCGAPNVAQGQDVIVALPNSRIANNEKIKKGKLRGVISMGMICALQEIGFSENVVPAKYKDGIYVFEQKVTPGQEVYGLLGMDDNILDFDITPNRADTLGMNGTAYEMGAIYDKKITIPTPEIVESSKKADEIIKVEVDDDTKTRQYRLRVARNIEVKSSPMWMQIRLWNAGIRPINNIVDITNYVLLEYGQPIHAFDLDKIKGDSIQVRNASADEKILALDDEEYELNSEDVVIADNTQAIAIAGVMGGKNTEIDSNTKNIVIESAVFDETKIRKTAQHLNLRSEASSRFEKGIDNSATEKALNRVAELITKFANGEILNGQIVGKQTPVNEKVIEITTSRINKALGLDITTQDIINIFDRLQFKTEAKDEELKVSVPARRWDISIDSDLIEEVIRLYGYDNLEGTLPVGRQTVGGRSLKENFIKKAKEEMLSNGFDEAITYSMVEKSTVGDFQMVPSDWTKVVWAMTEDHEFLRTNIIGGLLNVVKYNSVRKQENLSLFEQGRVFLKGGDKRPEEREYLAAMLTGDMIDNDWHHEQRAVDFFDIKSSLENLLNRLNRDVEYNFIATKEFENMHPGQTAKILANGQFIGFVGKIHPNYEKELGIKDIFVFQIDLDNLYDFDKKDNIYEPISKYPTINRDIALLIKEDITNQNIADVIKENGGKYLIDIKLFDIYQGKNIENGFKSMAYRLTFQNKEETLTDDQINSDFDKIVKKLQENVDAEIR